MIHLKTNLFLSIFCIFNMFVIDLKFPVMPRVGVYISLVGPALQCNPMHYGVHELHQEIVLHEVDPNFSGPLV